MIKLVLEIWNSFRALPLWVQGWVALILVPVNGTSLWFVGEPAGQWIAFLAIIAVLMNVPVLFYARGFSKLMAFPHLVPWTILLAWLIFGRPEGSSAFELYLTILLVVNAISLVFDYADAVSWFRGNRDVARPN